MRQPGSSAEAQLGLPEYRGHTTAEKFAFALLVVFILAAIAGVFGDGPLSQSTAASGDGQMRVEYQRFCRRHAQQLLDITVPTQAGANSVELRVNAEYLRRVQITEIFPQPLQSTVHQTGLLRFATDGSGGTLQIRMHLEAQHAGSQQARLSAGTQTVDFKQFAYP
ncbi:hypothetical protein JM946_19795 [Steroidobacter sp. S1-65]|uniref:Uncharacterized protein n=1 Tax=Steroidobacter gossypii TaxID=2805490 RepID=A0ABS1X196_9GAMM|nr:hypothetical protein [Steroidobacter gossypii]MBM0106986.1 hypothetical protein [Steroidobacter gossypii]